MQGHETPPPQDPASSPDEPESKPEDRWVDTTEAAEIVGFSAKTLRKWRSEHQGPRFVRRAGRVRYRVRALHDWMEGGDRRRAV